MKAIFTLIIIVGLTSISFSQDRTNYCGLYNSLNKIENDSTSINGVHVNDLKNIKIFCESLNVNKKYIIETSFVKDSRIISKSKQECKIADYIIYGNRAGVATRMLVEIYGKEKRVFNIKILRE